MSGGEGSLYRICMAPEGAYSMWCVVMADSHTGSPTHRVQWYKKQKKKMGACALRCTLCVMETVLLLVFVIFTSSSSFDLIHR